MFRRVARHLKNWILSLPLFRVLRGYRREDLGHDAKAGVNVALLDFPQGMAYAMIAGLPVQFGIYSSAIGSITGPIFASSRFLMLGPTNASAVLLLSGFLTLNLPEEKKLAALPILLLMIAAILFVGALLRVEVVIQYVSRAVIAGYITAAACLIIINQMRYVLGLEIPKSGTFGGAFLQTLRHLPETHLPSLLFSVGAFAVYFLLKKTLRFLPTVAVTLAVMTGIYQWLKGHGYAFETLPHVAAGHWPLTLPVFSLDLVSQLSGTAFAVAFLSLLESSSIAKALAARSGDTVDIRQQMCSMGVANTVNAFGSGMPVSGSLTRSMLNYSSGARSPVSSMISGVILVIGVLACGPLIAFIPKAALASLVILVGASLIRPETIKTFLRVSRSDASTFIVTFVSGLLFPLDMAIYLGVGLSILLFLKKVARPKLVEYDFNPSGELAEKQEEEVSAISIVHVEGDLFFGATDVFLDQMRDLVQTPKIKVVILRLFNAHHIDGSATLAIMDLVRFARNQGREVLISGIHDDIDPIIKRSGIADLVGEENMFHYTPENVTLSTRNALLRAQQIIGDEKADIILYAKEKEEGAEK